MNSIIKFLKSGAGFIASPSHSRTMMLVVMMVLVSAVSLTVIVAQQQQTTKQRASYDSCIADCNTRCSNPVSDDVTSTCVVPCQEQCAIGTLPIPTCTSNTNSCTDGTGTFNNFCFYSSPNSTTSTSIKKGTCNDAATNRCNFDTVVPCDPGQICTMVSGIPTCTSAPAPVATCTEDGNTCTGADGITHPASGESAGECISGNSGFQRWKCAEDADGNKTGNCIYANILCQSGSCSMNGAVSPAVPTCNGPAPATVDCVGLGLAEPGVTYQCAASCTGNWTSASSNPNTTCAATNQTCCWKADSAPAATCTQLGNTCTDTNADGTTIHDGGECTQDNSGFNSWKCNNQIGRCVYERTGCVNNSTCSMNRDVSPAVPTCNGPALAATGDTIIQLPAGSFSSLFTNKRDRAPMTRKDQKLYLYLYKTIDDTKKSKEISATLNTKSISASGDGSASFNLGKVPAGTYKILLKSPKYLRTVIVDSQAIKGTGETITPTSLSKSLADGAGDVVNDNILNIQDYNAIVGCFGAKKDTSSCVDKDAADLNDDGVIDGIDYNIFLTSLSFTTREGD